jgi:glycosyltransferase involved in cell wall biosynthesis
MTAARVLGISFSLTLHGSDLLLDGAYLDTKLRNCAFCLTISEFNRRHILAHFPWMPSDRVLLHRMGVTIPVTAISPTSKSEPFTLLSVGRLHAVKNHSFLIQGCFFLKEYGVPLRCLIAGEGPERRRLELLIHALGVEDNVHLLGHVPHDQLSQYYEQADLVVLTSQSEGIPLTLMEAMAQGRLVLAPAITGIPELVKQNETGFLYRKGALEEFVWRVHQIYRTLPAYDAVRRSARDHVRDLFDLEVNLQALSDLFEQRIVNGVSEDVYEDPVLQQI